MRDRDSPIEWTGEAHLVSVSCGECGTSIQVPEETAIALEQRHGRSITCGECIAAETAEDLHRAARTVAFALENDDHATALEEARAIVDRLEREKQNAEQLTTACDTHAGP